MLSMVWRGRAGGKHPPELSCSKQRGSAAGGASLTAAVLLVVLLLAVLLGLLVSAIRVPLAAHQSKSSCRRLPHASRLLLLPLLVLAAGWAAWAAFLRCLATAVMQLLLLLQLSGKLMSWVATLLLVVPLPLVVLPLRLAQQHTPRLQSPQTPPAA